MKFIALTELPQGQQAGEVFEATEDQGNVLVMIGAAKRASTSQAPDAPDAPDAVAVPARRRYQRRDITAEV